MLSLRQVKKLFVALAMVFAIATIATSALISTATVGEAKEWKKIRIGSEGAYPPFNYFDSDKNLIGFEIEIAKALCEQMKVECEFVAQDWDGMIPALIAGKYDAIMASMSITDERRKTIDFSDHYYNTPTVFIASKKNADMNVSPENVKDKNLGAQSSTIQANYLQEKYSQDNNVKLYNTQDQVYSDLLSGRLDALLVDRLVGLEWLKKDGKECCQIVGADIPIGEGIGVGLRQGSDELKEMFNKAIEAIVANGVYKKINDKYFNFSVY